MVAASLDSESGRVQDFSLDGYGSLEPIYEGAETYVFRAKAVSTGVPVILKCTKNEYPTQRELGRLRREFLILKQLPHDCGPAVISLEERGRGLVLVMADRGWPTLREVIDAGVLDVQSTLELAISFVNTLALVHAEGIVHKDITPRNVLVDQANWSVRLIDFGISARISRETLRPVAAEYLEGTPRYISPEQTGRMNRAVDSRSDLYSFGVVLYEMLTGVPPFTDADVDALVQRHLTVIPVPPNERQSMIPQVLADIVMMLLQKMPEERYQSDAGLRLDLEECLRQWKMKETIEAFPLRRRDKAPSLRGVQRLYGREADADELRRSFERACEVGPEFVVVRGYSGVGKSSLVHELYRFIAQRNGGYFISGKFDKISQDVPLAPVIAALRELMKQLLTESSSALAQWKKSILQAVAGNGRILTDLIPELELIIGPQPPVAEIDTYRAKNRFELTLQDFLHVFSVREKPLVIFLDDLQWIDPASQGLLKLLLTDSFSQHHLYVIAYRDNEVDEGHPLPTMLDEIAKTGRKSTEIDLLPLDQGLTTRLVADLLTSSTDEVADLAEVVFEKTRGNPFFVQQFLTTLIHRDLLRFDVERGAWLWESSAIRGADLTDNVVELMVESLRRLPADTQRVVTLASCIGHSFDLQTLVAISDKPAVDIAAALFDAMKTGLIVPLDHDYRFAEAIGTKESGAELAAVRYAFVHDRVLQAAYSLVSQSEQQQLHLQIGRHLRSRTGGVVRDEDILDVVHHLNRGVSGVTEAGERLDIMALDLRAGKRAKSATAYNAAAEYLRVAIDLLHEEDWRTHHQLCYDLHYEGAEAETFRGGFDRAKVLMDTLIDHAQSGLEKAAVIRLRVTCLMNMTHYKDALIAGSEALRMLGHPLEIEEILSPQVMMAELGKIDALMQGRQIRDLVDAPEIVDPALRMVVAILDVMGPAAFYLGPIAFAVVNFHTARFAIEHGHTDLCAYPYSSVGYCLAGLFGRVKDGWEFGKLAEAVNHKFPSVVQAARLYIPYASSLYMNLPLREATPLYRIAHQKSVESGEFLMLGTAGFLQIIGSIIAGDPLEELLEEADKILAVCRRTRDMYSIVSVSAARQAVACLVGQTKGPISFDDGTFSEEQNILGMSDVFFGLMKTHHFILKTLICLIQGKYAEALEATEAAEQRIQIVAGNPASKTHPFLRALAMLAAPNAGDSAEMVRRTEIVEKYKAEMEQLVAWSPTNFAHLKALVDAEQSRVSGDIEGTIKLYERAIQLAHDNKAPHFEAMASELMARFFHRLGASTAGSGYIRNAYRGFKHWGGVAKIAALEEHATPIWPSLREITRTRTEPPRKGESTRSHATRTLLDHTNIGGIRDAALVVRAAQEIASEIDLPRVIDRLAKLVLDNAGADGGALILARDGELYVAATLGADSSKLDRAHGKNLAESTDCAHSVVLYVARTQETVVIDNVLKSTRFKEDPYLSGGLVRSVLAVPLLHQGRLSGVLYLENRSTSGIFNAARVELLTLLSSQAAIAIDIARLIENVRAANEEVRRTNERLEQEVTHRTEELRHANESLSTANQRLEQELHQRLAVEEQRARLNEQMLASQKERLAELSTPLLPIAKDIVVIPLIGSMDTERADQVLSVALDGAQRLGSRFVILDVTGLKHVDTHTAGMLGNVASALRLLGAETVITGIRPKIAQTLIALDINLQTFVTMATLQSGMDYALAKTRGQRLNRQTPR